MYQGSMYQIAFIKLYNKLFELLSIIFIFPLQKWESHFLVAKLSDKHATEGSVWPQAGL